MDIQGHIQFGQGYWVDRFKPSTQATTTVVTSGGGGNVKQNFIEAPDGARKSFTLPNSPNANNLEVFLNGILQNNPDDYSLSGSTVTFIQTPIVGDKIVAYYGGVSQKQAITGVKNGINKIFTLPVAPTNTSLQFYWNGILQNEGDDYALSGNQITMTLAPNATDILVAYF